MKILQVHSKYKKRGGEETVVEEEKAVLEANGHLVVQYLRDNIETDNYSALGMIRLSLRQRNNRHSADALRSLIIRERPDVCHVHNVYPLISPAIYEVCKEQGVPVVQTLHNYKMLCTNSLLFRDGEVCEICLGKNLMQSVRYKCYKGSLLATAVQADTIQYHRKKGTWHDLIDAYVCLTEFQKNKMIEGGLPADKIRIKPNFVRKADVRPSNEDFFLFVGRLDESKGLADLLKLIENRVDSKFVFIGASDSPGLFSEFSNVTYLGAQSREVVQSYMGKCKAVIFPSKYYEGMPMVILEAFSLSKAVIARNVGAMSSMIRSGKNGLSYDGSEGLIEEVRVLEEQEGLASRLGAGAFLDYKKRYSVSQGYQNLIDLYHSVLEENHGV